MTRDQFSGGKIILKYFFYISNTNYQRKSGKWGSETLLPDLFWDRKLYLPTPTLQIKLGQQLLYMQLLDLPICQPFRILA
jgi:hypothetical protein